MQLEDSERRIKKYCYDVLKFCRILPENREGMLIENNIYHCIGSLITHFHTACHAKNAEDFVGKLQPVEELTNQLLFWLEFVRGLEIINGDLLPALIKENNEIQNMLQTTIRRLKTKTKFI